MSAEITSEAVMAFLKSKVAESGLPPAAVEVLATTNGYFIACDRRPGVHELGKAGATIEESLAKLKESFLTPEQTAAKLRTEAARLLAEADKLNPVAA